MTPVRALFKGIDANNHPNLWVTDGAGTGTSELTVAGANSNGLFSDIPGVLEITPDFVLLGGKVLFEGHDSVGRFNLWVTAGTTAGTGELAVAGASSGGLFPFITPG